MSDVDRIKDALGASSVRHFGTSDPLSLLASYHGHMSERKRDAMYVLYPGYGFEEEMAEEFAAIKEHFPGKYGHLMGEIPEGSVVLPRFRALPFGREMIEELALRNCTTLNSWEQHRWCADLGQWYAALSDITPVSWCGAENIPFNEAGPFIIKGETNSRRQLWHTHCYAETRADIGGVIANLLADTMIQHQRLWIRKFVPLHTYFNDVVGMPVSEEYRFFYYKGRVIAAGFYWANHWDDIYALDQGVLPESGLVPFKFLEKIGDAIKPHANFVAVDVARTASDEWIVIEVNDGQMAGCCGVRPDTLYGMLKLVARG